MKTISIIVDTDSIIEFNDKRSDGWGDDINAPFDVNDFTWVFNEGVPDWHRHPSIFELQTDMVGVTYEFQFLIPYVSVSIIPLQLPDNVVFTMLNGDASIDPTNWFWEIFDELIDGENVSIQNGEITLPLEDIEPMEINGVAYVGKKGKLTTLPEGIMKRKTNLQYTWTFAFIDFANNGLIKHCKVDPYIKNRPIKK